LKFCRGERKSPALFLVALAGSSFHNGISSLYNVFGSFLDTASIAGGFSSLMLAALPAYTMVGAASVLAALFRAPLTAILLLFELTQDYNVILPLMASAGFGSVVADILDDKFGRAMERRRDRDSATRCITLHNTRTTF
jgi:H+/Cl- antiporter ClcA